MKQLERMFGEEAKSALNFSSHRWGEQPLTNGNGGSHGELHGDMDSHMLRNPFVSRVKTSSAPLLHIYRSNEASDRCSAKTQSLL